ncbi:GTP-binding protein [Methylobacterium sp. C1]|uniref:CobW family GTP-binding protein n=1 Tax=Methylobacterium sp. C1 TaxID=1479019 RepID=UPI0008DAEA45|nr:GTP-binding protein [Methylobacterium sp. C1]
MTEGSSDHRIPVTIVAGPLGSGKTTFLRRSLADGALSGALLVVNEAADYGVDDLILRTSADAVALLSNGCLCCRADRGVQEELQRILSLDRRSSSFSSVVIELSGLAEPLPVIAAIISNPYLNGQLRIALTVTMVDCLQPAENVRSAQEQRRQIEAADVVLLTKTDLVGDDRVEAMRGLVGSILPQAPCLTAGKLLMHELPALVPSIRPGRSGPDLPACAPSGAGSFRMSRPSRAARPPYACDAVERISFSLHVEETLDWTRLALWLSMLLHAHGDRVLRVKGFLALEGAAAPVLINCVRHMAYFPEHLDEWPGDDRSSFLIFIVEDLSPDLVAESFDACVRRARSGDPGHGLSTDREFRS